MSDNYQASVQEPMSKEIDDTRTQTVDSMQHIESDIMPANILPALHKVSKIAWLLNYDLRKCMQIWKIVRIVRSSPQRKRQWLDEASLSMQHHHSTSETTEEALMLILDVKTRWSSTHQMLRTISFCLD